MSVKNNPFDYPLSTWKKYKVHWAKYGFLPEGFNITVAPNKTWARRFIQITLYDSYKVTRVEEVRKNDGIKQNSGEN
jgi:hypothetical protein